MAFFLLPLLFILFSPPATRAQPRAGLVSRTCNDTAHDDISAHLKNLGWSLDAVRRKIAVDGYGSASRGKPPTQTFAMAQCHADLSSDDCSQCFTQAEALLRACFPSIGGRVYLDGCFLRAENYSFYAEISSPDDTQVCGLSNSPLPDYAKVTRRLIKRVIAMAHRDGFSKGVEYSKDVVVYALADCWKSLDQNLCDLCLREAGGDLPACLPATDGRSLLTGCFLRYSASKFFTTEDVLTKKRMIVTAIIYAVIIIFTCVAAVCFGICLGRAAYKRINDTGKTKSDSGVKIDSSILSRHLHFKYTTLVKATDFFSETNKLGEGGYSQVYKGSLADGRQIAVKRLSLCLTKAKASIIVNEMDIISRAKHRNLVQFLGCSLTGPETLLVYEYLPNNSLDHKLFDSERKKELDWNKRLTIIKGVAEGLHHLHHCCERKIIHRDIKASNILLDVRCRPKIADFGLARSFSADDSHRTTGIAGTLGYMAPEYIARGRLSDKVDVYGFGIVMLEIISGKRNNKFSSTDSMDTLVTAAWKHFQSGTLTAVVDESMEVDDIEEVRRVAQIALLCTQEVPSRRPTLAMVSKWLRQKDLEIPRPSKPPFLNETGEYFLPSDSSRLRQSESQKNVEPR